MTTSDPQEKLDAAVEEFFRAKGWPGFCDGWVLVAHQAKLEESESVCPIVYMGGSLPDHVAIGLLQIGMDRVRGIGRWGAANED